MFCVFLQVRQHQKFNSDIIATFTLLQGVFRFASLVQSLTVCAVALVAFTGHMEVFPYTECTHPNNESK